MDRTEMMAAMKKDGCCSKSDNRKGSCKKVDEEKSCTQPQQNEKRDCSAPPQNEERTCDRPIQSEEQSCGAGEQHSPCNPDERQCGLQNESICVCVCCFQFAAPDQMGAKLQFGCNDAEQSLAVYFQQNWKDPLLSLPWQPPDGV